MWVGVESGMYLMGDKGKMKVCQFPKIYWAGELNYIVPIFLSSR